MQRTRKPSFQILKSIESYPISVLRHDSPARTQFKSSAVTVIYVICFFEDTMAEETAVEVALKVLQPIRDLAKNWDIDIASW